MRCFIKPFLALFIVLGVASNVFAQHDHAVARVDDHAPIGVMGEHNHKQGEWMTSYRYMYMDMDTNYNGSNQLAINQVHNDFMIAPLNMSMEMHMTGVMYGVTDDLTAMLMIPYISKKMDHRNRASVEFRTKSSGIGDVKLSGLYSLKEFFEGKNVLLNFGLSFPTGSISKRDDTPLGANQPLPYPMQIGSGTYDLLPGITYTDKTKNWSWGGQLRSVIRLGENDRDYTLGNRYGLTSWVARQCKEWLSVSMRLDYSKWGNIDGADSRLNINMVQTANPGLQAGERLDAFLGVNIIGQEGHFQDHRLALEVGHPLYQDLQGPQLGVGWQVTLGWQKAF